MIICNDREKILNENDHVLVIGGPGSGKTTIALKKAEIRIKQGILPSQSILFLSLSRAAVFRVIESATKLLPEHLEQLSIKTFHSFFWEIVSVHGYLIGGSKNPNILLPHDEAVLNHGIKSTDEGWEEWLIERENLFKKGKIVFDLFAQKTHEILSKSTAIRKLITSWFPLIIIDECQDTQEEQWNCIKLLACDSQLLCLADPDQQIYAFLDNVSKERIKHIRELKPLEVNFRNQNNRSAENEILKFGDDILFGNQNGLK